MIAFKVSFEILCKKDGSCHPINILLLLSYRLCELFGLVLDPMRAGPGLTPTKTNQCPTLHPSARVTRLELEAAKR